MVGHSPSTGEKVVRIHPLALTREVGCRGRERIEGMNGKLMERWERDLYRELVCARPKIGPACVIGSNGDKVVPRFVRDKGTRRQMQRQYGFEV